MKYEIIFNETVIRYGGVTADTATEEKATTDRLETSSSKVMAGFLRAKADELDPPKGHMR